MIDWSFSRLLSEPVVLGDLVLLGIAYILALVGFNFGVLMWRKFK